MSEYLERTNELDHDRGGNVRARTFSDLAAEIAASEGGYPIGFEAECEKCGGSFNPSGEELVDDDDRIEHYQTDDEEECGGYGPLVGSWSSSAPAPPPALVAIPGVVTARYAHGRIIGLVFAPLATPEDQSVEIRNLAGEDLEVRDPDGPFWSAMRTALLDETWIRVDAITSGDEETQDGPGLLIGWEE